MGVAPDERILSLGFATIPPLSYNKIQIFRVAYHRICGTSTTDQSMNPINCAYYVGALGVQRFNMASTPGPFKYV